MTDLQELLRRMENRKPEPRFNQFGIVVPDTGKLHPRKCFCKLKKYGKDVFDPALMPLEWHGCANCKS